MKRLKELRQARQLTLKDLANELGLSPQVISRYELEQHEADYKTTYCIAKFFDVSIEYLLGFSELFYPQSSFGEYSEDEQIMIQKYRALNPACKKLIKNNIDMLTTTTVASEQKKRNS